MGLLGDLSAWLDNRKRIVGQSADDLVSGLLAPQIGAQLREDLQAHQQGMMQSPLGEGAWERWGPIGLLAMGQAKAGGELGINNEFYKGGQFLPGSADTVKGAIKYPKHMRAGNKAEIEPGVYAPRPEHGMLPFKGQIADVMSWRDYRAGQPKMVDNPQFFDYLSKQTGKPAPQLMQEAQDAINAFTNGARWIKDGVLYDAQGKPL